MDRVVPHAFRRRAERPAIVGHRGVRGPLPENTIAAFSEAIRQGADAVELDVRPCKSGEIVVAHDPTMLRAAGEPRAVASLTLRELRGLDLGGGERVPTLLDVLELTRSRGVGVNVEIKYDVPDKLGAAVEVARLLGAWDRAHDLVVSSFDPWILAAHRALVPHRCHAAIVHVSRYVPFAFAASRLLRFGGVHLEAALGTRTRCAGLSRRGYVGAWTVNEPARARALFDAGVDVIITDEPERIRQGFEVPRR